MVGLFMNGWGLLVQVVGSDSEVDKSTSPGSGFCFDLHSFTYSIGSLIII